MLCSAMSILTYIISDHVIIYISGNRKPKPIRFNEQQTRKASVNDEMKMMTLKATTRCKIIHVIRFASNTDSNPASTTLMHAVEHTWECPYCRRPILRLLEVNAVHSSTSSASHLQDAEDMTCPENVSKYRWLKLIILFVLVLMFLWFLAGIGHL